jgi:hypothetical protein
LTGLLSLHEDCVAHGKRDRIEARQALNIMIKSDSTDAENAAPAAGSAIIHDDAGNVDR